MIKAAIIGAGYISRQHIRALQSCKHAELVSICDLSPAVAESVAEQFSIPE
jgi:predicted dehydrogenase